MNNEIQHAVESFVKYIRMGWETELAFDVAYDSVYDMIGAEKFLNICQSEIAKAMK